MRWAPFFIANEVGTFFNANEVGTFFIVNEVGTFFIVNGVAKLLSALEESTPATILFYRHLCALLAYL